MDRDPSQNLAEEVAALRERVRRLEGTLEEHGIVVRKEAGVAGVAPIREAPVAAAADAERAGTGSKPEVPESVAEQTVVNVPRFAGAETGAAASEASLESRIGSQWFNRIGILAVLIAAAWFLKLAIDNRWIGPLGRVLIGLVAGAGLVAWSERFRAHHYRAFSWSLKAIGSGVLYLSLWAAFSLYHLIGSPAAFAAMIAVTAFNGFLAWVQDAELLALYAIVGGFSTPLLLSTGENHEVALFTYLFVLAAAVLVLVALRPWSRLLCAAFAGTVFFFLEWSVEYYAPGEFGTTAFFLAIFFLIFAWAPRLVRVRSEVPGLGWDGLALVVVPLANAGLGFLGFYWLLESAGNAAAEPWVAVAFAAFYLLLLQMPARGAIRETAEATRALHLTIAVVFLTIAIPLKTHGRWLTIGWLAEGGALVWLATRVQSVLLRVLAVLCLALGVLTLVLLHPAASTTPFFNERFGTYLFGIAVCALVAGLAVRASGGAALDESAAAAGAFAWPVIAAVDVVVVNALILLAIGWEIHSYWWYWQWHGGAAGPRDVYAGRAREWQRMRDYRMYAQFTYSAFFMLFGAVLLAAGFWRRSAFLRWQALVLIAVTIAKVFAVDLSELSQGYRILSFLGLGALLLAVSFVYQRDWLHLRAADGGK